MIRGRHNLERMLRLARVLSILATLKLPGEGKMLLTTGKQLGVADPGAEVSFNMVQQPSRAGEILVTAGAEEVLGDRVELWFR